MGNDIQLGSRVKLLGLPNWLVHDLPESEQIEICSYIGQSATVMEIDGYGYLWLGFGLTIESGDTAYYNGHSFAVPREFVELLP
jgi:hypothetical protein